jgi:hypothetical protein
MHGKLRDTLLLGGFPGILTPVFSKGDASSPGRKHRAPIINHNVSLA